MKRATGAAEAPVGEGAAAWSRPYCITVICALQRPDQMQEAAELQHFN